MNRAEMEAYLEQFYSCEGEQPWPKKPSYSVYRHTGNRKWFAVLLDVPSDKLGLPAGEVLQVLNIKCDPRLVPAFCKEPGIFPGYHMNKTHWLTLALNGTAEDDTIRFLLQKSYELTKQPF